MVLQDQVIPIDFGQGIDTKTDPKLVVAGRFLELKDAVLQTEKRAAKRNGYESMPLSIVGGGNLSSPSGIRAYKDQLICVDQGKVYSFSEELQGWVNRGNAPSIDVSKIIISQEQAQQSYVSSAFLNGITLFISSTSGSPYYTVIDEESKTVIRSLALIVPGNAPNLGNESRPVAVTLGNSALGVLYLNSSDDLVLRILSASLGGGVSLGAEITIASDLGKFASAPLAVFDAVTTATGLAVSYAGSSSHLGTPDRIITKTLNSTGTVVDTATESSLTLPGPIAIERDESTGNLWIYFSDRTSSASMPLYYRIYSPTLSSVLSKTTIATGFEDIWYLMACQKSSTSQDVYISQLTEDDSDGIYPKSEKKFFNTWKASVNSSGTVTSAAALYRIGLMAGSRAFKIGSKFYAFMYYIAGAQGLPTLDQMTLFLVELDAGVICARLLSGKATKDYASHLSRVNLLSQNRIEFSFGESFYDSGKKAEDIFGSVVDLRGISSFYIDFQSQRTNEWTESSGVILMNGAIVSLYDGESSSEFGFNLFPEIVKVEKSSFGSNIEDGGYVYYAVYEWYDTNGELHRSAPSIPFEFTMSGGPKGVEIWATNAYLTDKHRLNTVFFRTTKDGTVARKISEELLLNPNLKDEPYTFFYDDLPDSDILERQVLYTTGNILDNTAPPPSLAMVSHNNRLWMINAEDPNILEYTKTKTPGVGLSPSGFLSIPIDPKFGTTQVLSVMDEKLVGLKDSGIFMIVGDGANDAGTGSTLSLPQFIPSDVGCENLKSTILTPIGLMFQSPKGIYLIDRKTNVQYIGVAVEGFNNQIVTSARFLKSKNEIRFLCQSGLTLSYSYLTGQWSTFTNHEGSSSDVYKGRYVYSRTDGKIYKETPGVYLDATLPFSMKAKTSWLGLAGVQGFQRVRRLSMLGDFKNGASANHKLSISIAYDFESSYSTGIPYTFGSVLASGTFQYRERLPRQKCDVISLLIEEVTTGDSAEYIDLTNMSFEAAVKKGISKMPAGRSVG